MSSTFDMWMTPGKRRVVRRTVDNGPYGPPDGSEEMSGVVVDAVDPGPGKLRLTAPAGSTDLVVGDPVIFIVDPATGTPEARAVMDKLRAMVDAIDGADITFSTAPTDLSASTVDFTGLVVQVVPV